MWRPPLSQQRVVGDEVEIVQRVLREDEPHFKRNIVCIMYLPLVFFYSFS